MRVEFTIPGVPRGKGRPRFNRKTGNAYTPEATRAYEEQVVIAYRQQCGCVCYGPTQPLEMYIRAIMPIPKAVGKLKRLLMEEGALRPLGAPDADNLVKSIADALQGVAYPNDAQVVTVIIDKFYGDNPRAEVVLESV